MPAVCPCKRLHHARPPLPSLAGSPSPVESWHNLVKKICAACEAELEKSQNKKRGPDASLIRLLREAVTNADGDAAGKPRRLLRVARTLFDMCWLGLTSLSPDMPAYKDFALLLRVHLLPVPDYCARGYPETFDALIRHCLSEVRPAAAGCLAMGWAAAQSVLH